MKTEKGKAKMGRPSVGPEKLRSVLVAFRLTRGQARALRTAARAAGLTLTSYILRCCKLDG
jgi:uncharacterized protein (DUF1778 family)